MLAIFHDPVFWNAVIVGALAAFTTGLLGNFLVASRQAVVAEMLSHVSLAGAGVGILFGVAPFPFALVACLLGGGVLWVLSRVKRLAPEAVSILILSGGLSIGYLLAELGSGESHHELEDFLFGDILSITSGSVVWYFIFSLFVIGALLLVWNRLLVVLLDPDFARSRFEHVRKVEFLFLVLTSLVVAMSLKVVGGLLVSAMLVIPVLGAQTITRSFWGTALWSVIFNLVGVLSGLILAFTFDLPASSTIVLSLVIVFAVVSLFGRNFSNIAALK